MHTFSLYSPQTQPVRHVTRGKRFIRIVSLLLFSASFNISAAECSYQILDEWNNGFKAEITIANPVQEITDWSLSWTWNEGTSINSSWNATFDCADNQCTATPPGWLQSISAGGSHTFGFTARKTSGDANPDVVVSGEICNTSGGDSAQWNLDDAASSIHYVSLKKNTVAEINTFSSSAESAALRGSISASGRALLSIDLNQVNSGIEIRDSRLLTLLFETRFLPSAYFDVSIALDTVSDMPSGSTLQQQVTGDFTLHGVTQPVTASVMVTKLSDTRISVSSLQPVVIDAQGFDLASGIEALRAVANLSNITEAVPVYFNLEFERTAGSDNPVDMPEVPQAPDSLVGVFDEAQVQADLTWRDNSDSETLFLVRRKPVEGNWQTVAELPVNATSMVEALPETGEYDYKVIALNKGVPSLPSNIARVTVTEGNQVVRGQHLFQTQCAGCHGVSGEGVGSFPAVNTERDVAAMVDYIEAFMPQGNAAGCDRQCAEDVATFIETLWVTEVACDPFLTPVSYGARQLKILTRDQYQRSVEDLLGVDYPASQGLSADSKVGFFTNNTYAAIVPTSYSNFLLVAEGIADWSASRSFSPALNCTQFDQDCADAFVDELLPKIFRRPVTDEERSDYSMMANGSQTEGDVRLGIQMAIEAALSSPQFLYRHELGEANPDNAELDSDGFELTSYEMATFLAYTFTGTTPDEALLNAAANDELRDEANIVSHAQRLTDNAQYVMSEFVGSWLGTNDLALSAKDPEVWAGFEHLVPHMQEEISQNFAYVMLNASEPFSALYTADYSFLNATLAQHYGIDGVTGTDFQKVPTSDRGGILANGAFMARWGESVETSPILRSVRVRRRMLCQDQPDPPAGTFAAREQKLAELSDLLQDPSTTNRLKYHRLTEDTPCTNCHLQYINPLGFGMEDFDTVGRVRSQDLNGNSIDANGELYAPITYSDLGQVEAFEGTQGLAALLSGLSSAQACLPKQMFRYVMGIGHQTLDPDNPEGEQLSDAEKSAYSCEVDALTNTMMNDSPRAMVEMFGSLKAVRYRKAWTRLPANASANQQ